MMAADTCYLAASECLGDCLNEEDDQGEAPSMKLVDALHSLKESFMDAAGAKDDARGSAASKKSYFQETLENNGLEKVFKYPPY